ncbi:hypothetical protein ACM46_19405 [Chryseobacterium angstadtii]|uniref:Uncharacterized protein n=2 Tax=Chryseobacterium angstadtii TaxID=558151 RepID=A0A0J7KPW7_9FLAO|nr:hypothetical protein ACM46_19405 [Chryseobacterium angstadtii]
MLGCTPKNIKDANQIINKIENYRKEKHIIPDNLNAIGINETEDSSVYYKKVDSSNYMVWVQAESSIGNLEYIIPIPKSGKMILEKWVRINQSKD